MVKQGHGETPAGTTSLEPHTTATLEGMTAAWREAADALRDSERRYRELVEYSLGLICTHDLSGTILSINPAAAASLGYRPEDGIGHNLRDFLAPDKRHLFDDYLRRIGECRHDEGLMTVVARDGVTKVWMYRNVLSQTPDGTPYVLGHAIDITARVAAERTLRDNEHALRTAHGELERRVAERTTELEQANDRLRVESFQREAAERSRESALVEQRDTLAFLAHFSDRLAPLVTFEELVKVVRRLPVPFLADATLVHVVNEHGAIRLLPDVADAAAIEEAAPGIPDDAGPPQPCYVTEVVRTGTVAILSADELGARPFGPGTSASALNNARAAAVLPLVIDGKVSAVLSLLSRTDRRYIGAGSLVLADVAHRTRLALERIQLYREAQEANRLKDEFLSTLSHELRTPLNAIYGWARILRGRSLDESTARAVAVIQRNAEAQIRLIEEVLDVSRIITGKMALAMEVVDVADSVRAAIDIVRPAMHAKRIRFDQWIEETVPAIRGDGHRLQQVFWNVLSNALKFTGNDGAISVWLRSVPGHVEFEIADTGVGIRRDVLPFVFDRFRQADSSTTRSHGGLGLGLTIVRHIVELHGGSVRAASPGEGQGATFTIQLPAPQAIDAAAQEGGAKGETAEAPGWPKLHGRTVLVVEDHDDARDLIASVLESAGARVVAASSTPEAMDRVTDIRPDMLVADLGLPGEDGYALLGRLRARYPDTPAIALTAYARSTDRDRALAHGFERHVIKPVDPTELVDHVLAVLSSH